MFCCAILSIRGGHGLTWAFQHNFILGVYSNKSEIDRIMTRLKKSEELNPRHMIQLQVTSLKSMQPELRPGILIVIHWH